jgi:putative transposase
MPRMPRCVFPDGLFHVATRGVAKMAIYHDVNDRRNFLSLLALAVHQFEWTCHAFCLMTNHYHLVLDTTRENLSGGMQLLNGDEDELEHVCLYVMENPVRAGLCKRTADWPWSACRFELG